jgi:hypothetical protein
MSLEAKMVVVGVARSLLSEGDNSNLRLFGAKHVRFGSTVSFRSNGKKYISNDKELISIYLL